MKINLVLLILVGILGIGTSALAVAMPPITLLDGNSSVSIDPYSQAGVYDWTVELSNQMAQNSYWYRIGGAGVASPISALTVDHIDAYATDATVYYTGASFDLTILYSLVGGANGSGTSDISQSVMVTNKTGSALAFHLFEYINFDLNGAAPGETGTYVSSSFSTQTEGATEGQFSSAPAPGHWEMGDATTLLDKLNTQSFTNLADASSPYAGDVAFIFQWDRSIPYGTASVLSQDLLVSGVVPEPSSMIALVGALGLIPALRRRRR